MGVTQPVGRDQVLLDGETGAGRRGLGRRGGSGAGLIGARSALARLIMIAVALVAALIVIGIALVLLKANPANGIVDALRSSAKWLAQPFDAIFNLKRRRPEIALNWGIAALVYFAAGALLARLIAPRTVVE